jgi:short-subunit dehydrogenase
MHLPNLRTFLLVLLAGFLTFQNHKGLVYLREKHATAADFKSAYGEWALCVGCSTGIGRAWARALASRGLDVVITARGEADLVATQKLIAKESPSAKVETLVVNLEDAQAWTTAIRGLAQKKKVGFVVYNAATVAMGYHLALPLSTHIKSANVNMLSVLVTIDALLPLMVQRGKGALVLMSSVSGEGGATFGGHYSATKAWTTTMAESLWAEVETKGVDVLGVLAGLTATPTLDAIMNPSTRNRMIEAAPEDVVSEALRALGRGPTVTVTLVPKIVAFLQWALPAPLRLRASAVIEDSYVTMAELLARKL